MNTPCVARMSEATSGSTSRSFPDVTSLIRATQASVPAALFHRGKLLRAGGVLMGRLPGLVGHAVDGLAALVLGHRRTLGVGGFLEPVRQAIAAEAGEVHQVDILDI